VDDIATLRNGLLFKKICLEWQDFVLLIQNLFEWMAMSDVKMIAGCKSQEEGTQHQLRKVCWLRRPLLSNDFECCHGFFTFGARDCFVQPVKFGFVQSINQ
jgi:hypothetical protein